MSILVTGFIVTGLLFLVVAAVGVVRLPDVFTRAHAVTLTDSLGAFFMLTGLALEQVHQGSASNAWRIVAVLFLLYLLNPVISHATVRAALRSGLKPLGKDRR